MRLAKLLAPAILIAFSVPLAAQTANTAKQDMEAITGCLQDVQAEYEKYEKLSEKAREKAEEPPNEQSCIGTVSYACQEKLKGDDNKGLAACNNREIVVWQKILQERVAEYLKEAKPNEAAEMKKVQSAWDAYKQARCGFAKVDNTDAATAEALNSACMLEQTAGQALWVDIREN